MDNIGQQVTDIINNLSNVSIESSLNAAAAVGVFMLLIVVWLYIRNRKHEIQAIKILNEQREQDSKRYEELYEKYVVNFDRLNTYAEQLRKALDEVTESRRKILNIEEQYKTLQTQFQGLRVTSSKEIAGLKSRINELEENNKQVQERANQWEKRYEQAQQKLIEQNRRYTDLERQYNELKEQLANTELEAGEWKERHRKMEQEVARLQDEIRQLTESLALLKKDTRELERSRGSAEEKRATSDTQKNKRKTKPSNEKESNDGE